ncbi:hypothetical protein EDD16DRAFT_1524194 [Pisolithus croceorrhizus]|nr:hypothetical protein EDD16DRAFT_1524194 [Pisolithus croceorrhizus]
MCARANLVLSADSWLLAGTLTGAPSGILLYLPVLAFKLQTPCAVGRSHVVIGDPVSRTTDWTFVKQNLLVNVRAGMNLASPCPRRGAPARAYQRSGLTRNVGYLHGVFHHEEYRTQPDGATITYGHSGPIEYWVKVEFKSSR